MALKLLSCRLFLIVTCFLMSKPCLGLFLLYYGNVLGHEMVSVQSTDVDVQRVIEYARLYAIKRQPWSLPSSKHLDSPNVAFIRKMNLVYSHNNVEPLYYEDLVRDKKGNQYGVTKFISLGNMYNFILSWNLKDFLFSHNFTVSEYPRDSLNIYSHTHFISSQNSSKIDKFTNSKIVVPKLGSSYFQYISESNDQIEQYSFPKNDLDLDRRVSSKHLSDTDDTEVNDGNRKNEIYDENQIAESFSIMTYNIWNFNSRSLKHGGYTDRMHRLRKTIIKANPDIIALQEVRYEQIKGEDLGPNQIHTLSEWLPQYQYVYQPAQMQPNSIEDGRTEEGVALMSKYPILSHNVVMLFLNRSNSADTHQRILLDVELFIPSIGKLNVLTTHLSLSHEAREQSVIQIWNYAKSIQGPVIILGDFNAEPKEKAMMYLKGKDRLQSASQSQLVDVWSTLNDQNTDGYTFNALERNLTKRIDYIFFKPWKDCCTVDTCTVLDDGLRGIHAASDHVPVIATFSRKHEHSKTVNTKNKR
ncbi:hypothetical protein ACF0H5_009969 [Mactra antiquata]